MPHSHYTIVPAKPFGEGKSRLAPLLSEQERSRLNLHLFLNTIRLAAEIAGPASVVVVSRSQEALGIAQRSGALPILETGVDLNAALRQATNVVLEKAAESVLILPTDLPLAGSTEIRQLVAAYRHDTLQIVPDSRETGTNILLLPPPMLKLYHFGPNSRLHHMRAAEAAGLRVAEQRIASLMFDVDTPEDYRCWRKLEREMRPLSA